MILILCSRAGTVWPISEVFAFGGTCPADDRYAHFRDNALDLLVMRRGTNLMSLQSRRAVQEISKLTASCCPPCHPPQPMRQESK